MSSAAISVPGEIISLGNKSKADLFSGLLTSQDIRHLTNLTIGSDAEVIDHSLRPFSDGTLGFLGSHQRLCIRARRRDEEKVACFFVKIVPYDVASQAEYIADRGVFEQETFFYRDVLPEIQKNYRGEPWAPTAYRIKKDLIVFEELSSKGYATRNTPFDVELVSAGMSAIARMHAACMLTEERLGERFDTLYPRMFEERQFSYTGKLRKWFEAGVKVAVAVAKEMNLDTTSIPAACDKVYECIKPSKSKRNVINHGDLWGNNLMFDESTPPKCLLIDFQLSRYCPLAHDVSMFLYACTTRGFRNTWMTSMVMHYYEVLCQTLESNDYRAEKPSWTEVIRGVNEQRVGAVVSAVMNLPQVLMDETIGQRIMSDPDCYAEFVFGDRVGVVLENMELDEEYSRRIKEIVAELVELANRMDDLPEPC